MPDPKLISDFAACTSPVANDIVLGMGNNLANTFNITVQNLLGNSTANVIVSNTSDLVVAKNTTPANSTVGGHTNHSFWFDDDYLYVVISDGTIKRAALSTFP